MEKINYDEIDQGMREIVFNFNQAGYKTTNCCEGHAYEDGTYSMPYLTLILPEDSTMTSFILNNLSLEMNLSIRIPAVAKDLDWVDDEKEEDGGYYVFHSSQFVNNHTVKDFELGIYLDCLFADENITTFKKYREIFLDHMLELSRYLVKVNEVYKECC